MNISSALSKEDSFSLGEKPGEEHLRVFQELLSSGYPDEYISFLAEHDGGEGFIGDQYIVLYRAADILSYNKDYEIEQYAPGFVLFGTNGGGEAFVFDTREGIYSVAMVPFIGMSHGEAIRIGDGFADFVFRLIRREDLFN